MSMRHHVIITLGLLTLCAARPAHGQISLPGAGEDKFSLFDGGRAITVTTSDAKVSVNWTNDPKSVLDDSCKTRVRGTPAYLTCIADAADTPTTFIEVNAAITGEKGKRTIFSDGGFTPGYELGFLVTRRIERGGAGGYKDIYGGATVSSKPLTVGTFVPDGISSLDDASERKVGMTAGVNFFIRENFGIGFGGTAGRAFSTTGLQKPVSLCTHTNAGIDKDGKTIQSSKCDDGFIGPLSDDGVGTLRIDVMKNFTRVKTTDGKTEPTATVGLIGTFNAAFRTGTATSYNVAFGPTLHPKGVPHKVLLALVLGLTDLTDASNQGKAFRDKFAATLYFGIPLTGF
jgi:hypothetical protein